MATKDNTLINAAHDWYLGLVRNNPEEKRRIDEKYLGVDAIGTPAFAMKDKELIEYIYEQEVLNNKIKIT